MESMVPPSGMLLRKSRMGRLIYGLASNSEGSSKQDSQGSLEAGKSENLRQSRHRLTERSDQAELSDKDDPMTDGQEEGCDRPPDPNARQGEEPQAGELPSLDGGGGSDMVQEIDMRVDDADIVMFETGRRNPG